VNNGSNFVSDINDLDKLWAQAQGGGNISSSQSSTQIGGSSNPVGFGQ